MTVSITFNFGTRPKLWAVYRMGIYGGKEPIWFGYVPLAKVASMPDAKDDEHTQSIMRECDPTIEILSLHTTEQEAANYWGQLILTIPHFIRSKLILEEKSRGRKSKGWVTEVKSGKEFPSASEAARYYGITRGQVSRSIKFKTTTSKGLKFRYADEY